MSDNKPVVGVFIIESLRISEEERDLYEGRVISNILHLNGIKNKYYYIRTAREFQEILQLFQKSNYKYLHISCHGADNAIKLTLDTISYLELGNILTPLIKDKRIFLSACSSVNHHIAAAVIPKGQCYSIIGPTNDIEFRDATIVWSSFYHLMFSANSKNMMREDLIKNIQKIVNTFEQPMTYYSRSASKKIKVKQFVTQATKTTITEEQQLK